MPETGARSDPFTAFRYEIRLDGITSGGFSECSGPQLETEFYEYAEGGANQFSHRFPTRTRQGNLSLKRGIVDRELWEWYYQLTEGRVAPKDGSIVLYREDGREVAIEWQIRGALPGKWQGADLNASQNTIAIETLELNYLTIERIK